MQIIVVDGWRRDGLAWALAEPREHRVSITAVEGPREASAWCSKAASKGLHVDCATTIAQPSRQVVSASVYRG